MVVQQNEIIFSTFKENIRFMNKSIGERLKE
jgi:hypothetical protein